MHFALQREMPGPGDEMVIVEVLKGPINGYECVKFCDKFCWKTV